MRARAVFLQRLVLAVLILTVSSRHHHHAKRHHGGSTPGRSMLSQSSAWDELPNLEGHLEEFELRLGRIKNDLDSAIQSQEVENSPLDETELRDQNRRRRREAKVVGSVLATKKAIGARKTTTYPEVGSAADWEKDLLTDDDDQLQTTFKKYVADPEVKGSSIAPKLQSSQDFADDFPVDDGRDMAEDARLQRQQEAEDEEVLKAKAATKKAQDVVDAKKDDFEKASKKTKKAKKKTEELLNEYSSKSEALQKAQDDEKRGVANITNIKKVQKDIRKKHKKAEQVEADLDRKLYKQSMTCDKLERTIWMQNKSLSEKQTAMKTQEKKLEELQKEEEQAKKEVQRIEKSLQEAQASLEKLEADSPVENSAQTKEGNLVYGDGRTAGAPTKSYAVGCHILPVMSLSLIAAVLW